MEVVTGFGNARVFCDLDFLETGMTPGRGECRVLQVKNRVKRMGQNNPVQQDTRKIKQVFDGMLRQAGPRSNVDVLVVQIVSTLVERFPVQ